MFSGVDKHCPKAEPANHNQKRTYQANPVKVQNGMINQPKSWAYFKFRKYFVIYIPSKNVDYPPVNCDFKDIYIYI